MDYTEIINTIEKDYLRKLSSPRAEHSRRTADMARELAEQYGVDPDKAYFAGISHDIAKEYSDQEILKWAEKYKPEEILPEERALPLLLHGRAAAAVLRDILHVNDEEILDSVTWHISGDQNMKDLDKVIYCADFLEPGRTFLTDSFRKEARSQDLDYCVFEVLKSILEHRMMREQSPSSRELALMIRRREREDHCNA